MQTANYLVLIELKYSSSTNAAIDKAARVHLHLAGRDYSAEAPTLYVPRPDQAGPRQRLLHAHALERSLPSARRGLR